MNKKALLFAALIIALIFISGCRVQPKEVKDGDIVYYTPNGYSYHSTKLCPSLKDSKVILEGKLNIKLKEPKGDPCNYCVKP